MRILPHKLYINFPPYLKEELTSNLPFPTSTFFYNAGQGKGKYCTGRAPSRAAASPSLFESSLSNYWVKASVRILGHFIVEKKIRFLSKQTVPIIMNSAATSLQKSSRSYLWCREIIVLCRTPRKAEENWRNTNP